MKTVTFKASELKEKTDFLNRYINRDVNTKHVNAIAKSIKKMGVIRDLVCVNKVGDPVYYIVDGQHLREACIQLGKGVKAKIISYESEADLIRIISMINSTAKSWGMMDYLRAWKTAGKKDYLYVDQIREKIGFASIGAIVEAYCPSGGKINKSFKSGEWLITSETKKKGDKIIEIYQSAIQNGLRDCSTNLACVSRYIRAKGDKFNQCKFNNGISKNKSVFSQKLNREAMLLYFEIHCK